MKEIKNKEIIEMDSLTMILIEDKLNIPLDVVIFMNGWVKSEKLNDENIEEAVDLWCENKKECIFKFGHISFWNTSNITNMSWIFSNIKDFNEDISNWNVSNVTKMRDMFWSASSFNGDIGGWNVGQVTNMNYMFYDASFNGDIGGWNVSNVTNMDSMFSGARKFNGDISNWNVSNVTNM